MVYKGVEYPFAFEFNDVPVRDEFRRFRIVISNYREKTQDFSGLCFENEYKVTSDIRVHYGAFFEIVKKLVEMTDESEQFYMSNHNGEVPKPIMTVTDPDIIELFEKRKRSHKNLEYYEELRRYFEKPDSILSLDLREEKQLDILDSPVVLLFAAIVNKKTPHFNNFIYFRT